MAARKRKKKTAAQKKRDLASRKRAMAKARRARAKYLAPKRGKSKVKLTIPRPMQARHEMLGYD